MAAAPDEQEDSAEDAPQRSSIAANPPAPSGRVGANGALTYEDGLRHAHDYLRGASQTNPFAGRSEYGDLATGKPPVTPVPAQAAPPANPTTIGTRPEQLPGFTPGQNTSFLNPSRNIVKETIGAPGASTNQSNSFAGLPRTQAASPEVGGTRAVPTPGPRARNQRATEPSKPAFFGG